MVQLAAFSNPLILLRYLLFTALTCPLKDDHREAGIFSGYTEGPDEDPMRRKRFTEGQVVAILKESAAGMKTDDVCRRHGICHNTFYH